MNMLHLSRTSSIILALGCATGLMLTACGKNQMGGDMAPAANPAGEQQRAQAYQKSPLARKHFPVTSTAFDNGAQIPKPYTADGKNVSPALSWSKAPDDAKQFAVVVTDSDAGGAKKFFHWLIYDLSADRTKLPQDIPQKPKLVKPLHATQGKNSLRHNDVGYRGPAPPRGDQAHHYHFKVYALDQQLDLKPKLEGKAVLDAIKGHILATGELVGTYQR